MVMCIVSIFRYINRRVMGMGMGTDGGVNNVSLNVLHIGI